MDNGLVRNEVVEMDMHTQKKITKYLINFGMLCVACIYIYYLMKIVVFKNGMVNDAGGLNLRPFLFMEMFTNGTSIGTALKNILGNIAIFIPAGFLLSYAMPKHKKSSIFIGVLLSVYFEIIQYIFGCGITDIDDVLLNTLGTVIGTYIYIKIFEKLDEKIGVPVDSFIFLIVFGLLGKMSLYMYSPNLLIKNPVASNTTYTQSVEIIEDDSTGITLEEYNY